jgi:cell division protein FtsZ
VLLSIAGGSDLGLFEVSSAADLIQAAAHEDANIIFGTVIDDALGDEVRVTVIAAGFEGGQPPRRQPGIPRSADLRNGGGNGRPAQAPQAPQAPAQAPSPGPSYESVRPVPAATPSGASAGQPAAPRPVQLRPPSPPADDDLDVPDFLK